MLVPVNDGRLYAEWKLYCEGREKPKTRGYLHFFCAVVLLPVSTSYIIQLARENNYARHVAILYSTTNFLNKSCSALFHLGRWSARTEILLQKIDHVCCSLLSAGVMLPMALLLFPAKIGLVFVALLALGCVWNFWHTAKSNPSVLRQAAIPATLLLFIYPFCFERMTSFEWTMMSLTFLFQGIGAAVFAKEYPDPCPGYFGYHEVFHVLEVVSSMFIFLANCSIVNRMA